MVAAAAVVAVILTVLETSGEGEEGREVARWVGGRLVISISGRIADDSNSADKGNEPHRG